MKPSTTERTPTEMRATYRAELSRVLRRSLVDHDVTQQQLADSCGTSQSKTARWVDHRNPEVPGASDIALMPRPVARDLIDWIGQHQHLHAVDRLNCTGVADHIAHLGTVIRECSDVQTEYASALSGGIDADERRRIRKEIREAMAALGALDKQLEDEERKEREVLRIVGKSA